MRFLVPCFAALLYATAAHAAEKAVEAKFSDGTAAGMITVVKGEDWKGDGKTFTTFTVTVKNTSGQAGRFHGEIKLDEGKAGSCTYYAEVAAGATEEIKKDCKHGGVWKAFDVTSKVAKAE